MTMRTIREDAGIIMEECIRAVLPDKAVLKALRGKEFKSGVIVVAIGKAAWNMAKAAKEILGSKVRKGIILTKYGHSKGLVEGFEIIEAGHPIPDENSVFGASRVLDMVSELTTEDQVLFLVSGGGSALFEKPLEGVTLEDIISITNQLLSSGAAIAEINTVRKHLSAVKGGRFACQCGGSAIYAVVLSDVLGDQLDVIASGPAYPDSSTSGEARDIVVKYNIELNRSGMEALEQETPKIVDNCETVIIGSVTALCEAAARSAQKLGYKPFVLSTSIDGEAKEVGRFFASVAREIKKGKKSEFAPNPPCAIVAGGETIVRLTGSGKGGRNQEVALSAALGIEGLDDVVLFSLGSDGTDGPTEAAGGIEDGQTAKRIRFQSIQPEAYLNGNNSYYALKASGDLIFTGATGTNVNDVMVLLCR